jgi:CheY-like chemotaxis protein
VSADGVAAAKRAITECPDLTGALLDYRLRDGDGVELFEWIAVHDPRLAERVAFVTGSTDAKAHAALQRLGRPILTKPFEIRNLWELAAQWEPAGGRRAVVSNHGESRADA